MDWPSEWTHDEREGNRDVTIGGRRLCRCAFDAGQQVLEDALGLGRLAERVQQIPKERSAKPIARPHRGKPGGCIGFAVCRARPRRFVVDKAEISGGVKALVLCGGAWNTFAGGNP